MTHAIRGGKPAMRVFLVFPVLALAVLFSGAASRQWLSRSTSPHWSAF